MRIRRIPLAGVKPGALVDGPVVIYADIGYQIDNMEGLAAHRTADRRDRAHARLRRQFLPVQRTMLLQFTLVEE